jgi:NAD(P)H dehydrogenase (quinone)
MGIQEAALGLIGNSDASGQVGRRVAQRLARQGLRQRLLVQDRSQAPELPQSEVAPISDYGDTESMRKAVAGVDTLLLIPIKEHPERVRLHQTAIAAVAAGVRRIVYSSFLAAAPDATFTFARHHYATEQHIRSTGVAFTFLRGSAFLEVLRWIIGDDGVIRGPAGNGRLAPVARDDLAEVAAAVLTADGAHDGQTYAVTGPESLSLHQVAEAFALVTGRPISYVDEPLEQAWASRQTYGAPDWQVEAWVTTYLQIANGELDLISDTVPRLTGHPALSLAGYLAAHPESYQHLLPS